MIDKRLMKARYIHATNQEIFRILEEIYIAGGEILAINCHPGVAKGEIPSRREVWFMCEKDEKYIFARAGIKLEVIDFSSADREIDVTVRSGSLNDTLGT